MKINKIIKVETPIYFEQNFDIDLNTPEVLDEINKYGCQLAEKCGWHGDLILGCFLDALTDANFHAEREQVTEYLNKIFNTNFNKIG